MAIRFFIVESPVALSGADVTERRFHERVKEQIGDRPPDHEIAVDAPVDAVPGRLRALVVLLRRFIDLTRWFRRSR